MGANLVPVLSGVAVLLTALATLLGVLVTRAATRRTQTSEDIKVLLDERRADRADDRAEIERLEELRLEDRREIEHLDTLLRNAERDLLVSRALEQALREQLISHGLIPHQTGDDQ